MFFYLVLCDVGNEKTVRNQFQILWQKKFHCNIKKAGSRKLFGLGRVRCGNFDLLKASAGEPSLKYLALKKALLWSTRPRTLFPSG